MRSPRGICPPHASTSNEALRLDDKHAEAHTLLGFTLGQQGDLPAAVRHLERAIALRPDSSEAHYNLGVASVVQRREGSSHGRTATRA